jgi:hypothetical protein
MERTNESPLNVNYPTSIEDRRILLIGNVNKKNGPEIDGMA